MRKKIICVLICTLCTIATVLPTMGQTNDCEKPDKNLMGEETNLSPQNKCAFSRMGSDTDNQKITSPIDLSSVSTATLNFYIQYEIDSSSLDSCYVHIEIDGGTWNELDAFNGYQHDWLEKSYDLSSMVGHNIRIRFRYHTGLNSTSEGTYIDRINVIGDGASIYEENFEGYEINDPWGEWIVVEKPGPNHPPYLPSDPNPANGSTYVNVNTNLSWTGGDPDPDDSVTYDVYFGTDPNPPNVAIDIVNTTYVLDRLNYNTQYYWRIDAWDSFDNSTTGTTWIFRTALSGNNPPNKPSRPTGPTHGGIRISYSYQTSTTDSNLDQIYYMFDWDDGTNSGWVGPYNSGQTATASHVWNLRGSYGVKVKAKDSNDYESVWSDPLSVSMPKNKVINSIFPRFLEQYPHLFPILKYLMKAME